MRIVHVPYSYFPDPPGGTEIYVGGLAELQRKLGHDVNIAAPGTKAHTYEHGGVNVWRFPVSRQLSLAELYGAGDPMAAEAFARILDRLEPEVVHLHAFTSAVSARLAEEASKRDIPVIFSYHTPTASCTRGTLLRWGTDICDGDLAHQPCTACVLNNQGLPRSIAGLISLLPEGLAEPARRGDHSGGVWTAIRMPELIALRIAAFHRLIETAEQVVAHCEWTRQLLLRNKVPEGKIILCRQGILDERDEEFSQHRLRDRSLPLRGAFFGRLDPTKGLHIVVDALKRQKSLPVHLDVYGISQGEAGSAYARQIKKQAATDPRLRMFPALDRTEVIARLRDYDFLVVPSQCLETGPLVVLEAFAAGTPVLGSDLGGIAELVTHGANGLLVAPPESVEAWSEMLTRISKEPEVLASLRKGIRPPRHMRDAANELVPVYASVLCRTAAPSR